MSIINLETVAADYGKQIAEASDKDKITDRENVITNALEVLAENGFYALNVFLLSCKQKDYGLAVHKVILRLLRDRDLALLKDGASGTEALDDLRTEIVTDLPRLIMAKRVVESALTFARYHCKALNRQAAKAEGGGERA